MKLSSPRCPARPGFTLIELLVVIAIIAVLIALALAGGSVGPRGRPPRPMHQQSEANRPGMHNYESAVGTFPMGNVQTNRVADGFGNGPCSASILWTAFVFVLPYMEQGVGYNAYNLLWPAYNNGGRRNQRAQLDGGNADNQFVYLPVGYQIRSPQPGRMVRSDSQGSYGENRGTWENVLFSWTNQYTSTCGWGGGTGMFMPMSSVHIAEVTDGTSNTFLFGEMSRFIDEPL